MAEVTLEFIAEQQARILDELRAQRVEMRRLAENQQMTSQSINSLRDTTNALRNDLELMIRTEIGGLFAHLETRLERRIDDALRERS